MADVLATNNAVSAVAVNLAIGGLSLTVATSDGAKFPAPTAGDYSYITLIDSTGSFEIVKCTARSGDVLTIVRAQDNTSAKAFVIGDSVQLLPNAATITDIFAAINLRLLATSYTAADVLAKLITVDGAGSLLDADFFDGQSSAYYTDIATRLGYVPLNSNGTTPSSNIQMGSSQINIANDTGALTIQGGVSAGASTITLYGKDFGGVGLGPGFTLSASNGVTTSTLTGTPAGVFTWKIGAGAANTIWTAGNDGAGSGLDADLLDAQQGAYYTNATNLNAGTVPTARLGSGSATSAFVLRGDSTWSNIIAGSVGVGSGAVSPLRSLHISAATECAAIWDCTNAGTDKRQTRVFGNSSGFFVDFLNDAISGSENVWSVARGTGVAVTSQIWYVGNVEVAKITSQGLMVGVATVGTSGVGVLALKTGTAPTTGPADNVQLYSSDNSAGNTIPSWYCEGTDVLATGQADSVSSVRVKMRINGTVVTLLAI